VGANWCTIHDDFQRTIQTRRAARHWRRLAESDAELARFDEPHDIVRRLTTRDERIDEKERVLRALVRLAQGEPNSLEASDVALARALLWLGLWPALDAIHRRNRRLFAHDRAELASQVALAFEALVARVDLGRIQHLFAALVWGTERDLRRGAIRAYAERSTVRLEEPALVVALRDRHQDVDRAHAATELTLRPETLHLNLARVVGDDAALVMRAALLGECPRELGAHLGVTSDSARKRLARATSKIRLHGADALSGFEGLGCF